ncbi:MAG: GtrA family protein, partial [Sphingopyxis sp.]
AASRGSSERTRQKALFVGSALVGLTLTTAIVGGGSALGLDARLAKLVAILVSFPTIYILRRHFVFRVARAMAAA